MNDFIDPQRKVYIINSNDKNKTVNKEVFIQGNKKKVELDRVFDELSINNNIVMSGRSIGRKIMSQTASKNATPNYILDSQLYDSDDLKDFKNKNTNSEINRGKEIIDMMKQDREDR